MSDSPTGENSQLIARCEQVHAKPCVFREEIVPSCLFLTLVQDLNETVRKPVYPTCFLIISVKGESMNLNHEFIAEAISNGKKLKKLLPVDNINLLSEYKVSDFIGSEKIPRLNMRGTNARIPAAMFFKDYRFLYCYETDEFSDFLPSEMIELYNDKRKYQMSYNVSFFDTFIVIDVSHRTIDSEFIVLTPCLGDGLGNVFNGMLVNSHVVGLFSLMSENANLKVSFILEVDQILECFRKGEMRKKFLGIF
ncbi:MAG: hypothetical protein GYB38_07300 [Gammaproteobacteria bacterium]|nr:hypothetical protein [Gammaproteobacteria bacterium]